LSSNPFYTRGRIKQTSNQFHVDERFDFVGFGIPFGGAKGVKRPSDDWEMALEMIPEISEYSFPMRSSEEEKSCLRSLYGSQRVQETDIGLHYLNLAQEALVEDCYKSPCPAWFAEGLPSPLDLLDVVADMSPRKSPGYPAVLLGREKLSVIMENFGDFYFAVCCRILALLHLCPEAKGWNDSYSWFCSDPVVVSIKNEIKKETKRARVFLATPVVAECVERLLYKPFSAVAKRNWGINHSCIGIGFTVADANRLLGPLESKEKIFQSDVPSFDVTVTCSEEYLNCELVRRRYQLPFKHPMSTVLRMNSYAMMNRIVIFSDGVVWAQRFPGGQATGRYLTACFNTEARARRSYAADFLIEIERGGVVVDPFVRDAGDDAMERFHPLKEEAYLSLGFPLRDVEIKNLDEVEFCSHLWSPGVRPVGVRIVKSVANLLYKGEERDAWESFLMEYSNHPHFDLYVNKILVIRPGVNLLRMNCDKFIECKKKKKKNGKSSAMVVYRPPVRGGAVPFKAKESGGGSTGMVAHGICSLSNALCAAAYGAKYPDLNTQKTWPYGIKGNFTMNTDANGASCFVIVPGYPYGYSAFTSITSGVATMPNMTVLSGTAAFAPAQYRLVSFGVKIVSQTAPLSASGRIIVAEMQGSQSQSFVTIDTRDPNMYADYRTFPIANYDPIFWLSRRGSSQSNMFEAPNVTTISAANSQEFSCLVIAIAGGPAAVNCLQVEYFGNYELIFGQGTANNALTTPPKGVSPAVTNGVAMMTQGSMILQAKSEEVASNIIERLARKAASAAITGLGTAMGAYMGGPEGAMVGYKSGRAAARMVD
jgi:hypothetical protein